MHVNVLVAEIGSTTTIVNAFDGLGSTSPRFVAQGKAPTTVLDGDVRISSGENGFSMRIGDVLVQGSAEKDVLTFATDELMNSGRYVRISQLPTDILGLVNCWLDAQGAETVQANTVHSSLFTRSVSADVTSDMLIPLISPALEQAAPLMNMLGVNTALLKQVTELAEPGMVWGRVTRYKGDERQYPDLSLLRITLDIPGMPHVYVWLRTDEFGSTLRVGAESSDVIDWDETLLAIEEGRSSTGFMVDAFTLVFEDDEELNTYYEAKLIMQDKVVLLECDHYLSYTDDYLWALDLVLTEETQGEIASLWLEAMPAEEAVQVSFAGLEEITLSNYLRMLQEQ